MIQLIAVVVMIGITVLVLYLVTLCIMIGTNLCNNEDRIIVKATRREYGLISPYRMGAVYISKKWSHIGARAWTPFVSTMLYGMPLAVIQLFPIKSYEDKRSKVDRLFNKLISKETGFDN